MYMGHLIFFLGLALVLASWIAARRLRRARAWFELRVREDERGSTERFGDAYRDYCRRVKRWIPGVY
jgi:protein-S-isoprenylcysteine O-methyltransferase Ste14